MKKVFKVMVLFLCLISLSTVSYSTSNSKAKVSHILGDDKGNVYYKENADVKLPLASMTKVMTLILAMEALERNEIQLYDEVTIDQEVLNAKGSSIPLTRGEKVLIIDLLKASAIKSANNATYALAKHIGGSIDNFVVMMNEKAKSLGLENDL